MTPLKKLPKNGEDWGKFIVAKAFKKLPKVQNIAQSGHTAYKVNESSSALPAPKVLLKGCRISQPEDENVPGHSNGIQVQEHLIDVNTSCHCLYEAVRLWHWPIDEPEWI